MRFRILLAGILSWLASGYAVAALPVGSVVMYSDGKVEKLLAVEGSRMIWEDDRKRRYVRSSNPILPLLEKHYFLSGRSYTQTLEKGDPNAIFDLPVGRALEFSVVRRKSNGEKSTRNFECKRLGKKKRKVLGKRRTLDRFVCERFTYDRKTWVRLLKRKHEFLYSRDLGLIVDSRTETSKRRWRAKLVDIVSPSRASYKRLSRKVRELRGRDKKQ